MTPYIEYSFALETLTVSSFLDRLSLCSSDWRGPADPSSSPSIAISQGHTGPFLQPLRGKILSWYFVETDSGFVEIGSHLFILNPSVPGGS